MTESKTGRARIIYWSPELRKLLNGAMERASTLADQLEHAAPTHVFTGRYGTPWTMWAVQSQMRRLNVDWHFHDLRAKAATDPTHAVLGKHSTLGTYLRGERTNCPIICTIRSRAACSCSVERFYNQVRYLESQRAGHANGPRPESRRVEQAIRGNVIPDLKSRLRIKRVVDEERKLDDRPNCSRPEIE